jgi:penicillin-binding protein 2
VVFLFIILFAKLWYMAVLKTDYYRGLAQRNHVRVIPLVAPRGLVYDRDGRVLVDNIEGSNLVLFLDKTNDLAATFQFLEGLNVSPGLLEERLRVARRYPKYQSLVIKENVSMKEMAYVLSHQAEHPELAVIEEPRRIYRYGRLAAHALGYVGEISEKQLRSAEFSGKRAGDVIGKYGIERSYDRVLSGTDGRRRRLVNSVGRTVQELGSVEPVSGRDLRLTLDLDLQLVAESELGDDPGAIVAFDPHSGDILAMASRPAFDPNAFATRISLTEWNRLVTSPDYPLQNRVIQGQFSPGSVFKVIVALAGLERGLVDEQTAVHCSGGVMLYDRFFHCWNAQGHGTVTLTGAIQHSCNTYFYLLGQKLGIGQLEQFSRSVGLGRPTGVDLYGEAVGLVPSEAWKRETTGRRWYAGETISVAIGQGPVNVTPIQLARAIGIVATGQAPTLHLAAGAERLPPSSASILTPPQFDQEHLKLVRDGMSLVVNQSGTGSAARMGGFEVCGKTSTAQTIGSTTLASLSPAQAAHFQPNAWFVGFAPRDRPEIMVAVIIQRGGGGGAAAAPVAGRIFQAYFQKYHAAPVGALEIASSRDVQNMAGDQSQLAPTADTTAR